MCSSDLIAINIRDEHQEADTDSRLGVVDTYLVGKAGDPRLKAGGVKFTELDGLPIILTPQPTGLHRTIARIATRLGVTLNPVIETDTFALHLDLAAKGLGYAILWPQAIEDDVRQGRLASAPLIEPRIVRSLTIGTSVRQSPSRAVRHINVLVSELVSELASSGHSPQVE